MIELISDIIFLISIAILSLGVSKLLPILLWYDDNYWGVIVLSFTIGAAVIVVSSGILSMYIFFYAVTLLAISPVEYIKLQSAIVILISSVISFIISVNVKNKLVDYGLKKRLITKQESKTNLFGGR
ncbi:membrane-associated HD superfamily phosphohydrolase [Methanococcus maripaludis]|uniref:Membrane-associated HD superfamily phosphohydrolase n=1 Tax=Methanococcus maripaludis TaxID=39152 RepID=A0A7J9P764_METMI|nr:hypothetical protein [Methanococcus maripaludis]MBA2853956.1 membrane-associated HD superfamily phosphohydrolase [Methanococcus maripaludis]